jgi:hypothetical protein
VRHPFDKHLAAVYSPLTGDDGSRWRLTLASILLGLTLLAGLAVGGYQVHQEIRLEQRGVEASAVVRQVLDRKRRTVVALPDGRELTYRRPRGTEPTVGHQVKVRYDPEDLSVARDAQEGFRLTPLWPLLVGTVTIGYIIQQDATLHRRMRRNPRTNLYELI